MKKNLVAAVVAVFALFGVSASAQRIASAGVYTACFLNGTCKKYTKGSTRPDLFKGILLSDRQKADMENLRIKAIETRMYNDESMADASEEERSRIRANERKAYLMGLKEILTDEQYAIYLENATRKPAPENTPVSTANEAITENKFSATEGSDSSKDMGHTEVSKKVETGA